MRRWIMPDDKVEEPDVNRGLRALIFDGICSQTMGVLVGGAFLVQFAFLLGASNAVIGVLAAVGPFTQFLQIPAVFLVDRTQARKAVTIAGAGAGRLCLLVAAAVPWICPQPLRVPVFLVALLAYYGLGAIAGCAWNSWMRDLVPQKIMGSYFAGRLSIATAVGAVLTLFAGYAVDRGRVWFERETTCYSLVFLAGIAAGLLGLLFLAMTPEPRMKPSPSTSIWAAFSEPFRDGNFRKLLVFLGMWNFAINFSAPFFTVYMLKRLDMSMTVITVLVVLSQAMNVLFFRIWGRAADRFTNKPILWLSGFLFVVSIAAWPFTTMPNPYFLTWPIVVLIHLLAGMSTAGVAISGGNIALKLAPYGRATAYLAANGFICGIAATLGPLLGGVMGDFFESRQLHLTITWLTGPNRLDLPAVRVEGLDFLFVLSVLMGLYSLHRLLAVREEGEVEESIVVSELVAGFRQKIKHVSSVGGLRNLAVFPYQLLRDSLGKSARKPARATPAP
jgi:MFS family permease